MKCNNDLKVGIYPLEVKLCVYPHVYKKITFCEGTTLSKYSFSFLIGLKYAEKDL